MKRTSVMPWAPVSVQTLSRTVQQLSLHLWLRANSNCLGSFRTSAPSRTSQTRKTGLWRSKVSVCYTVNASEQKSEHLCLSAHSLCYRASLFPWGPERPNKSSSLVPTQAPLENRGTSVLMLTCACLVFAAFLF